MKTRMMVIVAMVGVIAMAGVASAAPILNPGDIWVETDNGGNNDGPANGWLWQTTNAVLENGTVMRWSADDTEMTMTVTGLAPGDYDVAVVFGDYYRPDQGLIDASLQALQAGLVSGSYTELSYVNLVEPGIGNNATWTGVGADPGAVQVQSNPGVIGTGVADGSGNLNIYFLGTTFRAIGNSQTGGEAFVDGVVLTPLAAPIPEPAGLGLIGLALLAVRRRRS